MLHALRGNVFFELEYAVLLLVRLPIERNCGEVEKLQKVLFVESVFLLGLEAAEQENLRPEKEVVPKHFYFEIVHFHGTFPLVDKRQVEVALAVVFDSEGDFLLQDGVGPKRF